VVVATLEERGGHVLESNVTIDVDWFEPKMAYELVTTCRATSRLRATTTTVAMIGDASPYCKIMRRRRPTPSTQRSKNTGSSPSSSPRCHCSCCDSGTSKRARTKRGDHRYHCPTAIRSRSRVGARREAATESGRSETQRNTGSISSGNSSRRRSSRSRLNTRRSSLYSRGSR